MKARKRGSARHHRLVLQVVEHGLPQRAPALRRALAHALHTSRIRAQAHAEHVRAHLAADALALELAHQIQKNTWSATCASGARAPPVVASWAIVCRTMPLTKTGMFMPPTLRERFPAGE